MKKYPFLILAGVLAGCTTHDLNASKTITIAPSDKPTQVRAQAHMDCRDNFITTTCRLVVDAKPVEAGTAPQAAPGPQAAK